MHAIIPRFPAFFPRIHRSHPPSYPICLMFHRVGAPPSTQWSGLSDLTVSRDYFDRLVKHIAETCRPLPAHELVTRLNDGRPLPPRCITITFDDGYLDNLTHAAPVLNHYNVPATINVTTSCIDQSSVPIEFELESLIRQNTHIVWRQEATTRFFHLTTDRARADCYHELRRALRAKPQEQRRASIDQAVRDSAATPPSIPRLFLNWQELKRLSASPHIDIGGHSHHHIPLTSLTRDDARLQIQTSAQTITEHLKNPPFLFSYPHGATPRRAPKYLRAAAYRAAVTTRPTPINRRCNTMALPRMPPPDAPELTPWPSFFQCR